MMAAQIACINWPRAKIEDETCILDRAEDDDTMQGFYDVIFTTWTIDEYCRRLDSTNDDADEKPLNPHHVIAYAEGSKPDDGAENLTKVATFSNTVNPANPRPNSHLLHPIAKPVFVLGSGRIK